MLDKQDKQDKTLNPQSEPAVEPAVELQSQDPRVSIVKKSIQRTINTAKYEGIVIKEHIEERVEWTTLQEREKKIRNWTLLLIQQYKDTEKKVMKELELHEKKAHFVDYIKNKDNRPSRDSDSGLDELDELGESGNWSNNEGKKTI